MLTFPVVARGSETLKYVFPAKQRNVQKAIEIAPADERIDRLILFGSAVTLTRPGTFTVPGLDFLWSCVRCFTQI